MGRSLRLEPSVGAPVGISSRRPANALDSVRRERYGLRLITALHLATCGGAPQPAWRRLDGVDAVLSRGALRKAMGRVPEFIKAGPFGWRYPKGGLTHRLEGKK